MAFAEIHCLVGCIPAAVLPFFAMAGSSCLILAKESYNLCINQKKETFKDNKDDLATLELMTTRMGIRVLTSLIYAYSISYFFFIQKTNRTLTIVNCIFFELLNFMFIAGGIAFMILSAKDVCAD